jgi:hypothetical protein
MFTLLEHHSTAWWHRSSRWPIVAIGCVHVRLEAREHLRLLSENRIQLMRVDAKEPEDGSRNLQITTKLGNIAQGDQGACEFSLGNSISAQCMKGRPATQGRHHVAKGQAKCA